MNRNILPQYVTRNMSKKIHEIELQRPSQWEKSSLSH
jgi:hypothetical protein